MRIFRCSRLFVLTLALIALPAVLHAGVFISVGFAPPPLPVYVQPPCPAAGYIWTPGYWSYGPYGYYWVPGTWVLAPQPGFLWTPGYWGYSGAAYVWYPGYWGPRVGYYGGIPYGYGYNGYGYQGGYWRGNQFYYNRAVSNVTVVNVHNTYYTNVNNVTVNRVSYNGPGGIQARPTAAQETAMHEQHIGATSTQLQHERLASQNQSLRASVNQGRPPIAATARPTEFHGTGVMAASNAPVHTEATAPHPTNMAHPTATNNVPRPPTEASPYHAANPNGTTEHGYSTHPTNESPYHAANPNGTPHESNNVPRPPEGYSQPHNSQPYGAETPHNSGQSRGYESQEPRVNEPRQAPQQHDTAPHPPEQPHGGEHAAAGR